MIQKKIRKALWLLSVLLLGFDSVVFAGTGAWGVLILSEGGDTKSNRAVEQTVKDANLSCPIEIVFGSAETMAEQEGVIQAILRLQSQGVERIVAVPFLLSSHSETFRRYERLAGLLESGRGTESREPALVTMGTASQMIPTALHANALPSVQLAEPLNDSPELADAVIDRFRSVRTNFDRESVIMVGSGPSDDKDRVAFFETFFGGLGRSIRRRMGHEAWTEPWLFWAVALADSTDNLLRRTCDRHLELVMEELTRRKRSAVVVPLSITPDRIDQRVRKILKGSRHRMAPGVSGHPALSKWISRRVNESISESQSSQPSDQ